MSDNGVLGGSKSVTPSGVAAAVMVICALAALAIPRLRAVSEERDRAEVSRILSAYPLECLPPGLIIHTHPDFVIVPFY
ncbi:MAG: hypothetical protein LBB74_09545 [Chitinispirillales bacterium]|nr:hypothetical protein [Chitinispirillales bacterium]